MPVLILQHLNADGPAYLETWLQRAGRPFAVFNTEAGQAYPPTLRGYSALAVLGGEMSANDGLPSLRDAERLILEAISDDVPVIGHCLGGQLMARALGARVSASPAPEIGWHRLRVRPGAAARRWLGERDEAMVFQWHYDAFELPRGAQWIAQSDACPHQAFAFGPHLAMQFHVELDAAKLAAWTAAYDPRFDAASGAGTVHDSERMVREAALHLGAQQRLADRLYSTWLSTATR